MAKAAKKTAAKKAKNGSAEPPKKMVAKGAAISESKLKSLMKSSRQAKNDISEIAGALGSEIKAAVENNHLHRKAFGVIKMADRMEPEKLADFLDSLALYLDMSGLNERASKVQRMAFGPGETEESDDEDEDGNAKLEAAGNVRAFPAQTAVAAE